MTTVQNKIKMLHELLVAMAGFPGDVFLLNRPEAPTSLEQAEKATRYTFEVSSTLEHMLHDAEKTCLLRLAQLGAHYRFLADTCDSQMKGPDTLSLLGAQGSCYKTVMMGCIKDTLDGYVDLIVKMEKRILDPLDLDTNFGKTPLSLIEFEFEDVKQHLMYE